jgi:hypothetical protein
MQLPEHGPLLLLVSMHPAQDVIQHVDCFHHVRPEAEAPRSLAVEVVRLASRRWR